MDIEEHDFPSVVARTSVMVGSNHVVLCIDSDQGSLHAFTMNLEQSVTLIAQLEAAYCCQFAMA